MKRSNNSNAKMSKVKWNTIKTLKKKLNRKLFPTAASAWTSELDSIIFSLFLSQRISVRSLSLLLLLRMLLLLRPFKKVKQKWMPDFALPRCVLSLLFLSLSRLFFFPPAFIANFTFSFARFSSSCQKCLDRLSCFRDIRHVWKYIFRWRISAGTEHEIK